MAEHPALTPTEQAVWSSWVGLNSQLPGLLQRRLQAACGVSLQDLEVLAVLASRSGGRMRISDLAQELNWERSRLSHHLKRMESRALLRREECAEDGRGAFALISPPGQEVVERATPRHAHDIRELVFDGLSGEDVATFWRVLETMRAKVARSSVEG